MTVIKRILLAAGVLLGAFVILGIAVSLFDDHPLMKGTLGWYGGVVTVGSQEPQPVSECTVRMEKDGNYYRSSKFDLQPGEKKVFLGDTLLTEYGETLTGRPSDLHIECMNSDHVLIMGDRIL